MNDVTEMFNNWASDPQVTKYLTWSAHNNKAITKKRLLIHEKNYQAKKILDWGIVVKDTNTLIDTITVVEANEDKCSMEIGYVIGQNWWRKGYTSEVLGKVIEHLFTNYPWLIRIEATHDIQNPNYGKVMQKCGLQFEGILRQKGKNRRGLVDIAIYAILREDGKFQK